MSGENHQAALFIYSTELSLLLKEEKSLSLLLTKSCFVLRFLLDVV